MRKKLTLLSRGDWLNMNKKIIIIIAIVLIAAAAGIYFFVIAAEPPEKVFVPLKLRVPLPDFVIL